jgi:hypothetical protein
MGVSPVCPRSSSGFRGAVDSWATAVDSTPRVGFELGVGIGVGIGIGIGIETETAIAVSINSIPIPTPTAIPKFKSMAVRLLGPVEQTCRSGVGYR